MIYGIGVDMTRISRVQKACEKASFVNRYFSQEEIQQAQGKVEKLAADFAAKEAFSKALGTGIRGFALSEVSLLRDELGKPYYAFTGKAQAIMEEKGLVAHASVSDEEDWVIVFTVLETKD